MTRLSSLVTLVFTIVSIFSFGQGKDQKASALLDQVSAKAKTHKSIKVDFTYSMVNQKAKIREEKSGTLLISGDRYRMNVAGQTVISDGTTVWTYLKESNEVQINTLDNKDDAMTPSKLLTSYNANYKAKMLKGTDENTAVVELTPNAGKNFTKALLGIDKVKKQVKTFTLYDKSGNMFTYTIKNYVTDTPVTPADFVFDSKKFPGVEVIDMR